jgi:hypothetical protein
LSTTADPFESGDTVAYFVPHWETFPDPVRSSDFATNLERCDTFVLEYAQQWMSIEPDLETNYSKLARGEIRRVRGGMLEQANYLLKPFTDELQEKIYGCNKRILLERPPVDYVETREAQIARLIKSRQFDEAISFHKSRQLDLANSMAQRDDALLDLVVGQVREGKRVFVFRGAAHERYLTALFSRELSMPRVLRFEDPPLSVRIVSALTMNEKVDDLDFLRVIYALVNLRNSHYGTYLNLQKEAEAMSDKELRDSLGK